MKTFRRLFCLGSVLGSLPLALAETIVDDHFDDNVVTGWESVGNILLAQHNITEEDGALTSQVIGTEANLNTNRGIVNTTPFNPLADPDGFSMTFEIISQGELAPGANGMFLGLTSSAGAFYRDAGIFSFGLVFYGLASRTESQNGVSLITNDIGLGGSATEGLILNANPDSIELASLQDGCSVTITADPSGWSFTVEGVSDQVGEPTTISNSGTWAEAGTDFASVFNGSPQWYVLASNQGDPANNTHTVVYDRIALATGKTSGNGLAITSITPNLGTDEPTVTLIWNAVEGSRYAVDASTSLTEGSWEEIQDSIIADGPQVEFIHSLLPNFPTLLDARQVYYRIRLQ